MTCRPASTSDDLGELTPDELVEGHERDDYTTRILSTTHRRIDEVQVTMLKYFDNRIAKMRHKQETRLDEFRCGLVLAQRDIEEIRRELQQRIDHSPHEERRRMSTDSRELASGAANIRGILARVDTIERKFNYLENQSRRSNVRIDGVPEKAGETWEQTEAERKKIFTNKLGLDSVTIERAHRTGKKQEGNPRSIVVKLLSYKDRESILRRAKERRPGGIYFNPDFSQSFQSTQGALL